MSYSIYALPGAGMARGEENIDFLPRELRCFIPRDNEQRIPGAFLCNTLQTAVYICSEQSNFL